MLPCDGGSRTSGWRRGVRSPKAAAMQLTPPAGTVAVIFTSRRTADDDEGYAAAADAMDALARSQPGYVGIVSARGADGFGITISYWMSEAAAIAWRDNGEHAAIRAQGRARWYEDYGVVVADVSRAYAWAGDRRSRVPAIPPPAAAPRRPGPPKPAG